MASHYSDIGFQRANQDEVVQLAISAAESGTKYTTCLGDYIVWSPGEGAELWVHVVGDEEISQLLPHYACTSRMMCSITELMRDPEYPLEFCIVQSQMHSEKGVPGGIRMVVAQSKEYPGVERRMWRRKHGAPGWMTHLATRLQGTGGLINADSIALHSPPRNSSGHGFFRFF